MNNSTLELGLDVGSMTVKAVVLTAENSIEWHTYRRHNSRQAECVRDVLAEIKQEYPETPMHISITGSGARSLKDFLHAEFIQEVNALTLAVEIMNPAVHSVIELGGQDAKVIIWKGDGERKTTLAYMNDKCAGGTGSTIDKIMAKIGITPEEAAKIMPDEKSIHSLIHKIAAKCGVFAETDVVGLLKAGIPREEIFISLCHAIVKQNLEVLVHGNVLPEKVALLGGPNTFIPAFAPVWRYQIKAAWDMHGYKPHEMDLTKSIIVPTVPHFYAAIGAVFFTRENGRHEKFALLDPAALDAYIAGRGAEAAGSVVSESIYSVLKNTEQVSLSPLVSSEAELEEFHKEYSVPEFTNVTAESVGAKTSLDAYIGIDGGSTSTKIVLIDAAGELLYRDYLLSQGNPLEDARYLFTRMAEWRTKNRFTVNILGAGVTGYAQDILKAALKLDVSVVETVAHMRSATALYGNIDVICDIGGQDIKVLFMRNKRVVDFKLNTQCSAGNGYFLQSMANQCNVPIEQYAEYAFHAKRAPKFNYGCAVFMEQDRVNFQQSGWSKEEMMSGLAQVLPLNIWTYVVQESNLARLGKRFVLQGGTQKNLAAVKAQGNQGRRFVSTHIRYWNCRFGVDKAMVFRYI
jgi:activator of 2-hydroxyglutaryl-CoA dehydratase